MKEKNNIGLSILLIFSKVVFLVLVVMIIYHYAQIGYSYGYQVFNQTPITVTGDGRTAVVTILDGESARDIGKELENKGLIEDADLFYWQERFSEYHGKEKAGTYTLSTAMTPDEMLQIMAADTEETTTESVNSENAVSSTEETESLAGDDGSISTEEGDAEGMPNEGGDLEETENVEGETETEAAQ